MGTDANFLKRLETRAIDATMIVTGFDCDKDTGTDPGGINWYLTDCALDHHRKRIAAVTCWLDNGRIVGYTAISMSNTDVKDKNWWHNLGLAEIRFVRGQKKEAHKFPAMLIGMLGVDKSCRSKGLGKEMVRHALICAEESASKIGCRFVHVHALPTDEATGLYAKMGFDEVEDTSTQPKTWMYFDLAERK